MLDGKAVFVLILSSEKSAEKEKEYSFRTAKERGSQVKELRVYKRGRCVSFVIRSG